MAKKYPAPPANGELNIPAFLDAKKRGATPPPAAHSLSAAAVSDATKPFNVPKGMTEAEYKEAKEKLDPTPVKAPAKEKKVKKAKVEPITGTLTLADICRKHGLDPRAGRRYARGNKKAFSALFAQGRKYLFLNEDEAKVVALMHQGAADASKKKVVVAKKAKATKLPPAPADETKAHQDVRLAVAKAKKPAKSKFASKK